MEGKTATGRSDIISSETYGTSRANAYKILEETLNLKDVRIYDTIEDAEGKPKRVLNKRETMLAQQKQQVIKDAFANWVWQDPQRRIALVRQYNELFNSTRPREYDGSHIHFVGMNPEISLREHQRNAIAHVLYGGNTLLAHEVGAGKTFEMAASAMEAKRLGLCQKSLFVVPNHLTEQWASEFLHLYPNAKLLVARRKDFETANRKKFCARIATGDYDAVIIGHSQFERIPLSFERQERIIQDQIVETLLAINELKAKRYNLKEMSKTLIFLQENKIGSIEEMQERVNATTAQYHELGDSIKAAEQRMAEIAVLRAHIVNYARTRHVYDAYRKAGYSKKFLDEHREQITLHRAAKAAFDEAGLKKLPKVKELNVEYAELLAKKKSAYPEYRKARDEMQELMKAQKNVEMFFAEEKVSKEKAQTR